MAHELPQLAYAYDTLEPHIDAKTMEIHHSKHHQGYTNKFNAALEKHPELFEKSVEELLRNIEIVPKDIRTAVRNNGGGYYNHKLFWETLGPNSTESADSKKPKDKLEEAIELKFSSFESFKEEFNNTAAAQFGSGWAWLCVDSNNELLIAQTSNQDSPLSEGLTPILALDVWEHAYYLKYQNKRPDYIQAFWNVVNWEEVERKYLELCP